MSKPIIITEDRYKAYERLIQKTIDFLTELDKHRPITVHRIVVSPELEELRKAVDGAI